jgi:hypothetical protein
MQWGSPGFADWPDLGYRYQPGATGRWRSGRAIIITTPPTTGLLAVATRVISTRVSFVSGRSGACTLSYLKNNPPHTRGENENSTYFFPPSLPDNAKFKGLSSTKAREISYPGFCSFTPNLRGVFLAALLARAKHYYRQSRLPLDVACLPTTPPL